jgi:hypothetical protein
VRAALCAALLALGACCPTPVVVKPNPALTLDCDYPLIEGETWRALAEAYERRGEALRECSRRMRALRGESPGG